MSVNYQYLLTDGVSAVAIVVSLFSIYVTEEITFRRARTRILEMIGEELPFPIWRKKDNRLALSNYQTYHAELSKIPILPSFLLGLSLFISTDWYTLPDRGIYPFLIHINPFLMYFPFIFVVFIAAIFGWILQSAFIYKRIKSPTKERDFNKTIYLLRMKRLEFYFLSITITISFLFFTKTFAYLLYFHGNYGLPLLRNLGTLASFNSVPQYYSLMFMPAILFFYFLPRGIENLLNNANTKHIPHSLPELESEILQKETNNKGLHITVTEMGGNKFTGKVTDIGSFLAVSEIKSNGNSANTTNQLKKDKTSWKRKSSVRWNYVTVIEIMNENDLANLILN